MPVPVLAFRYFCPIPVLARYITGTGIKWCQYRYWHICSFVQYQYWHGTLPVPPLLGDRIGIGILVLLSNASIVTVHYRTGIKWFQYRYWHICSFVQYQYWHGTLPVLPLLGAHTGNGKYVLGISTSMGTFHYQNWN